MDEVLVAGEQPGPALWRVTSRGNVLWLLGEVSQLPATVTWRSKRVEDVIAASQLVLLDGGIASGTRTKDERKALARVREIPDGRSLKDVLRPDLYAQVEIAARAFSVDKKSFYHQQPFFAASDLFMSSMKPLGVVPFGASKAVAGLARKAGVRVVRTPTTFQSFAPYLHAFKTGSTGPCLEAAVFMLEDRGAGVRALGNAWALGDIEQLRQLVPLYSTDRINQRYRRCGSSLDDGLDVVEQEHAEEWLTAAQRALAENESTLAVVPIGELFATDGYLAKLQVLGYDVAEPT